MLCVELPRFLCERVLLELSQLVKRCGDVWAHPSRLQHASVERPLRYEACRVETLPLRYETAICPSVWGGGVVTGVSTVVGEQRT